MLPQHNILFLTSIFQEGGIVLPLFKPGVCCTSSDKRKKIIIQRCSPTMCLQQRWKDLCTFFNVKQEIVDEYWDMIESKYTEKHRRYHTLSHLSDMFKHFDDVRDQLSQAQLVGMAIFFHDVVYDPKKTDNEERSAEIFLEFAKNITSKEIDRGADISIVFDWIIDTKRHETEVHRTPETFGRDDLHFFLDMDMAILGSPDADYTKYADDIRIEYQHIPEPLFRERRAAVLRSFLGVPNIYATERFRTRFENQARQNIRAEIHRLDGKT